ncbi:hypothetical protein Sru01_15430 [Sphaerisporangium rufum]|uniref:Cysteine dioxygenase n=1 Tax=Sphaerisporangium rufum TaxID=1381558 RepID=A0A919R1A2_9ACTN|nr:cysteine dioxygenase family protein [Sphaerisporangium rufum]GII76561.1 hypothetical protein Sru01_15430 [Sphaerisporangium rufum]
MTWDSLPDRYLDKRELRALVDELAARPDLWAPHVEFGPAGEARHYASLHRDSFVDVWVICWRPEDDTGWHDHDVSSGALRVVSGSLVESNPRIGGAHVENVVEAGGTLAFGPDHIHRVTGHAPASVSIHAYSPPLWRLGQYTIGADGVMRRTSVSYADELRQEGAEPAAALA